MDTKNLLFKLRKFRDTRQQEYGIEALGIFGSYARGQARPDSDVDVVVKLSKQDLFIMIGIKQDLEEVLHLPVDLVSYRPQMDDFLKRRIDKDALYV
jgi:uncharacterized protein